MWLVMLLFVMMACSGAQDWQVSGGQTQLEGKVVVNTINFKIDNYTNLVTGVRCQD